MLRFLVLCVCAVALGAGAAQLWLATDVDVLPELRADAGGGTEASAPASRAPDVREDPPAERVESVPEVACPDGVADCTTVAGRVVFVESVDPDGDGDLHVVVADARSISAPGLTSIDVPPDLRPARDPRIGERVAAAGPVQTGSFGQGQIHALRFRS